MNAASLVSALKPERARSTADAEREREPERQVPQRAWTALALAGALAVAVYAVIQLWFVDVQPSLDDQGLFNPIYLFTHTGRMIYPIYPFPGSTQAYFVHPPGDAVFVGAIQWLTGWPAMAAGIASLLLLVFIALVLVGWSRFSFAVKFGLFAGIAAGLVAWGAGSFLRPDDRLAAAFIAGLVGLESGRLAGWAPGRLGLGALLVCISSTLHYPGSADVLSVAIYAIWVVVERRSLRRSARPLAALALGSALVLIPYAALFAIPFWGDIKAFTNAASNQYHGVFGAFRLHRAAYHYIYHAQVGGAFLSALASPFTRFGIPLVFVTTPILYWRRETRGIALASLPNLLFLLFFTHTKVGVNFPYYATEFTLYYSCLAYLAVLAVSWAARPLRLAGRRRTAITGVAGAAVLALVFFLADPIGLSVYGRDWHPDHADMEIARAATASTLPPDSVVVFNPSLNLWYTTGGWTVYPIWRDLSYASDLSPLNLRAYFDSVTAVGAGEAETWDVWAANNVQHQAVGNWYAQGLLKPFRFYFGRHPPGQSPEIRYLLLSPRPQPVVGNVLDGDTVTRYAQATNGSYVLAETFCDVSAPAVKALSVPDQAPIFLPGRTSLDPYADERQGHRRYAMQTFLDTRADYLGQQLPALRREGCRINAVVPLRVVSRRPASKVLDDYQKLDQHRVMKFPDFIPAANALYKPSVAVQPVQNAVGFPSYSLNLGASGRRQGLTRIVETGRLLFSEAAVFPLQLHNGRRNWAFIDGRVTKGQIEYCLFANGGCAVHRSLPSGASGRFYLPVPVPVPANPQIWIGNENPQGPSEIAIKGVGVEAARGR
jgi:prepilin-type processing-associated H-X9-DG protein